jgi:hypothetical protein
VSRHLVELTRSDEPRAARPPPAHGPRREDSGGRGSGSDWRVVDDLPSPVPISARELDIVERWLAVTEEAEPGRIASTKCCANATEWLTDDSRRSSTVRKEHHNDKADAN